MRVGLSKAFTTATALTLPGAAYAQEISPAIAAFALSPILVLGLAITLGIVSRSWWVGIAHAALVGIWILLFAVASYWVESDAVIWTPIAVYAIHAVVMVGLIVRALTTRTRD